MPWIPSTTIASSAGTSAETYKHMNNKSNKITWLIAFLISALVVSYFVTIITDNPTLGQMYNQQIAEREKGSVEMTEPEYTVEKTFFLTHSDGASLTMKIVKFKCCNRVFAMANIHEQFIGFDYYNKAWVYQIGKKEKQEVPVLHLTSIAHELLHISTMHYLKNGANGMDRAVQEKMAYNFEHLLTQILSLEEDGYLVIQKI